MIKYFWFENDLIFIDYINNDPDDIKIENTNTKKINEIKNIIAQDPEMYEIEQFFGKYIAGKEIFLLFLKFLKTKNDVELDFKQTKIGVKVSNSTFSIVRQGRQGGRKSILQINTDFDVTSLSNKIQFDDRDRGEGQKKKGSLGLERYEVFFRNSEEIQTFIDFIKTKI